uniref:Peptidase A2 domain-containing protein n=1 Tax=Oryzias latipes TaxID=8090 RepID=A0A3P9HJN9_ORYLA
SAHPNSQLITPPDKSSTRAFHVNNGHDTPRPVVPQAQRCAILTSEVENPAGRRLLQSPLQAAVGRQVVFLPETFSGSERDWSDWAEQFEIAADVNNWDDALKLKFMSLLLSGRAREVYSGLSPSAKTRLSICAVKLTGACTEGPMPAPTCEKNAPFKSLMGGSGYLKAKIGGFDCHALIDTGASRSVISKSMWLVITNGGTDLGNYVGKATTVNGGQLVVLGSWQTVWQLATLTLPVEFLVSELTSDEILLRFDFLAKHSAIVDLGQNVCQIKGKCFPLDPSNPKLHDEVDVPIYVQIISDC